MDSDIGPSELSDIAEEPEEGLTDDTDDDQAKASSVISTGPSYDRASMYKANGNALSQWPSSNSAKATAAPAASVSTKSSSSILSSSKFGTLGSSQFQAQPLTVEPSPPVAAMPKAVPPPDASPEVNSTKPKKIENQHVYRATAVHITHNDPFSNGNTSSNG